MAGLNFSCNSKIEKEASFSLVEKTELAAIPGSSGISVFENSLFIVGDNSPFLYRMDLKGNLISKTTIYSTDNFIQGEIQKNIKPDFEAMELVHLSGGSELVIFGSGSKSPERDIFLRVLLKGEPEVESHRLDSFYDMLRGLKIMKDIELNIEAVAYAEKDLLLLNRDENLIFRFNYQEFLEFLMHKEKMPLPEVISVDLPEIDGIEAGFSGATYLPESQILFVTASVEDTPNAYDDGKVLGSFVGAVPLNKIGNAAAYKFVLLSEGKDPIPAKVESVAVSKIISENEVELFLVTDSDGGISHLLRGILKW